jgi:hypothetical protein
VKAFQPHALLGGGQDLFASVHDYYTHRIKRLFYAIKAVLAMNKNINPT